MVLEYTGDAHKAAFKHRWSHLLRQLRTHLSDRVNEGILGQKLRNEVPGVRIGNLLHFFLFEVVVELEKNAQILLCQIFLAEEKN